MRTSIADILRGLGEIPPSDIRSVDRNETQPIEIPSDPPVSIAPWLSYDIRAGTSFDVLRRIEEGLGDDRSLEQRRIDGAKAQLVPAVRSAVAQATPKRGWRGRSAAQIVKNREMCRLRAQAKHERAKAKAERAEPIPAS